MKAIHDEKGYRDVRRALAAQYDASARDPDIQVVEADLSGGRRLTLQHRVRNGILLDTDACERTLQHVAQLWGYRVKLVEVDADTGKIVERARDPAAAVSLTHPPAAPPPLRRDPPGQSALCGSTHQFRVGCRSDLDRPEAPGPRWRSCAAVTPQVHRRRLGPLVMDAFTNCY